MMKTPVRERLVYFAERRRPEAFLWQFDFSLFARGMLCHDAGLQSSGHHEDTIRVRRKIRLEQLPSYADVFTDAEKRPLFTPYS
jgi:hypothetical protein